MSNVMSNFEFIKYEPTPSEKHMGVATVKLYGKIILRYKIVPNKDGSGYFPCAASYKMPSAPGGQDIYVSAFMLDSNSEKEELENLIRANVKQFLAQQHSVFAAMQNQAPMQQQRQPNPAQMYYQQPVQQIQQPQFTQPSFFPDTHEGTPF